MRGFVLKGYSIGAQTTIRDFVLKDKKLKSIKLETKENVLYAEHCHHLGLD
jgi:hypothetical protein